MPDGPVPNVRYTAPMPKMTFASFPDCCRRLLRELEKEGKTGARNCEKGHAVSLDYARLIETRSAAAREPGPTKRDA